MIEDIIYWITVFEDKDIVKRKINKQYADRLSAEQLKKILKLKFKGWGRYSSKLLNGIKGDMGTTIIEMLEDADEDLHIAIIVLILCRLLIKMRR